MNLLDRVMEIEFMDAGGLGDQVAAATRDSFADADPLPGLPLPDGAFETAATVAADLAAGARLWVARDDGGALLGSVRALPRGGNTWEVRRLGVVPAALGTGVGRRLIRALEEGVAGAGADRVVLDAVVERGNPPVYAAYGYRTVGYLPNPDKPLSEVRMERRLGTGPTGAAGPRPTGTLVQGSVLVDWFGLDGGPVVAVLGRHAGPDEFAGLPGRRARAESLGPGRGQARHLGTDAWAGDGADPGHWRELLALHADRVDPERGLLAFHRHPADIAPYLMPRTVAGSALALYRSHPRGSGRAAPVRHG